MNIAIITGGESGEREVSINSASNVAQTITFAKASTFVFPEDKEKFIEQSSKYDIVIPMIHGTGGEDGELQLFLESLGMPYLFSSARTHQIGIDKIKTKRVAHGLGMTTPEEINEDNLSYPVFAKPRASGSSLAAELCEDKNQLNDLRSRFSTADFIFEKPIHGQEFTVGVVGTENDNVALPVIEIISKTGIFDYQSKYDPNNLAQEICPAQIDDELAEELRSTALKIHNELKVKHMSRSDFIVDDSGNIFFLEINTIPGLTKTSLIPKMLATANMEFESLLKSWVTEVLSVN